MNEQKRFADEQSFPYALVSDPDQSVGRAYDAVRQPGEKYAEMGLPRRISYLIAPDGTIARTYDFDAEGLDLDAHAAQVLEHIREAS